MGRHSSKSLQGQLRRFIEYINMDAFLSFVEMRAPKKTYPIMGAVLEYPIMVNVGIRQSIQPRDFPLLVAGGLINGELLN